MYDWVCVCVFVSVTVQIQCLLLHGRVGLDMHDLRISLLMCDVFNYQHRRFWGNFIHSFYLSAACSYTYGLCSVCHVSWVKYKSINANSLLDSNTLNHLSVMENIKIFNFKSHTCLPVNGRAELMKSSVHENKILSKKMDFTICAVWPIYFNFQVRTLNFSNICGTSFLSICLISVLLTSCAEWNFTFMKNKFR